MWRRVVSVALVWIGLSGLLPAAACIMDRPMPMATCCPEHANPCNDHAPVTPEPLECCALDTPAGPIAMASVEKARRLLADDLRDGAAAGVGSTVPHFAAAPLRAAHPPPLLRFDQSGLWLQTARLRL